MPDRRKYRATTLLGEEVRYQFGRRVRRLRRDRDLSQEALAHMAGLDRTYVGGVERGERNLSLVNIGRLAGALGVEPSALMEGSKELSRRPEFSAARSLHSWRRGGSPGSGCGSFGGNATIPPTPSR
jgi:ribosome-binding protein aMBF1 (putative translation factor)